MNELTPKARNLRKNMTEQEKKLWAVIKNGQFYGYKFLRQYIVGTYIADFVCREKKIIIEIDGGQHNQSKNISYDDKRTEFLKSKGYKIVRFWNNDIDNNMEGVYLKLQEIFEIKTAPTPTLPQKGGSRFLNIKNKNLYYIGGVVRDEILGLESFDIDLTYDGNAIEFAKTIPDAEIVQINEPFGTVRIRLDGNEIDIASTRSEAYPHKGHLPVVDKIGCSLKEDVMRRDFTINAMAKSTLTGEIIDYTGGLEDIKNKKLRVLHDESFMDDPTRILRALKFAVRFGFELDEHTAKLQDNYLKNINYDMSYKRLKKELIETFNLNRWDAFKRFVNQKIYKLVAPQEFKLPDYDFSGLINALLSHSDKNIWIIYAGLLPEISSLPLTKTEKNIVDKYRNLSLNPLPQSLPAGEGSKDFLIYKALKNIPLESVIMYSTINHEVVEHYLNNLKDIELELNGEDLKELGMVPSEKYQECFDFILREKIQNNKLTKQDEIMLAKEFFNC